MALKSQYTAKEKGAEIEELLHVTEKLIDRLRTMYEQYFMGIQKVAPAQLHRDAERKLRELTQLNIRNTALRFRFATIQQRYGSYNTYWRRTLRQIEQGRYHRDLRRIGRRAAQTGEDIPAEILAAMPKRMRARVVRDRDAVRRRAERTGRANDWDEDATTGEAPAYIRSTRPPPNTAHEIDEGLLGAGDNADLEAVFDAITKDAVAAVEQSRAKPSASPARAKPPPIPPPRPRPKPSAPPPRRTSAAPANAPPPGMTSESTRALHQKYLQARKLVGEKGDVSYERLLRTLNKQAPRIMKQHKAKGVEFNVVIKNDRVVLKAKPKKK